LKRLDRFAGNREAEQKALDELPRQGRGNDALRRAIEEATQLARMWLSRTDAVSVGLAQLAALDQIVIEAASAAAAALDKAHVDATLEGRKSSHDSPIVNLEEGNVLLEMAYAIDIFDEAHGDNDVVPRLVPGPATRHVLSSSRRAPAELAPEPVAATAPPVG
jgi:2-keto-3-deoxy-L-rhamnonate aldolase RhmA